jgi:hypothetical protein
MGFAGLPDFSEMAAITCDNLIVFRARVTDGILFRELVHVEQYRPPGIQWFSRLWRQRRDRRGRGL